MLPLLHIRSMMPLRMRRWLSLVYARLAQLSWDAVGFLGLSHFLSSWLLLQLSGEALFRPFHTFVYFYMTTATTVGYGDLSPTTVAGRYVVTLFVMPGGISLFTTVIAKLAQAFADQWSMRMKGLGSFEQALGHVVILGWSGKDSERMIELFRGDHSEKRDMILVATMEENPMPGVLGFVRALSLSDPEALTRAGVSGANLVVAVGKDDNETLTAALSAGAMNERAHLVAYFNQPSYADILGKHCENAESIVSMSMENTVRAAQDPGSFEVVSRLLSSLEGPTQYRIRMPRERPGMPFKDLFSTFKTRYNATVLGVRDGTGQLELNPPPDYRVAAGCDIYYLADQRILPDQVKW